MKRNPYWHYVGTEFSGILVSAINQAAKSSAAMRRLIAEMEGQSIAFELTDFNHRFVVSATESTMQIDTEADGSVDLTVRSKLTTLVKLLAKRNVNLAQLDGVEISGDLNLLQRLYTVFQGIEFDWEEAIAKRIGDIPARQLGNLFRWGECRSQALRSTWKKKIQHTLVDHHYIVPTRARVNTFLNDIDDLQADLDRVEKRLERLERNGRQ